MRLISTNEKNDDDEKEYDDKKEYRIMEEDLETIYNDKEIQQLGLSKDVLREKQIEYKKETGKSAVWEGRITNSFRRYLTGQKVYERSKERISLYVSEKKKKQWSEFIEGNESFASFSKLIRVGVDYYIKHHLDSSIFESNMDDKDIFKILFEVKESLTAIKGFSELLLKEYKEELSNKVANAIENIYEQCQLLESKISYSKGGKHIDVLLIEDNQPTVRFFEEIFKNKGYSYKIATTGQGGLNELKASIPKIILLDIKLPEGVDMGYKVCKQIKGNNNLKHIPVFYETAYPEDIVKSKKEETGVDGYFIKPFDLSAMIKLLDSIIFPN
ncbi:MAG: response regulator [Candidatus Thorarchaeota archaeon]